MAEWLDPQFTNLVPNPDFASGVGGWVLQNATATAEADSEGTYGAISCTTTSNAMYVQGVGKNGLPVTGGKPYTFAFHSSAETVGRLLEVRVYWYDAAGAALNPAYTGFPIVTSDTVDGIDYSRTMDAPANASYCTLWIRWHDGTGGEVHHLNHVAVYELPTPNVTYKPVLTNLLTNPSFDFPTLTGWITQAAITAVRDATVAHTPGGASMLVTRVNSTPLQDVVAADNVAVTVGKPYRVSGWFKRKNAVDTHVSLLSRNGATHDEMVVVSDDDWHRLSFTVTPTTNTLQVFVGLRDTSTYADQACYVDDVCLVQEATDSFIDFNGDTPDSALYQFSWSGIYSVMSRAFAIDGYPVAAVNLIENPSFTVDALGWNAGNSGSFAVVDTEDGNALEVTAGATTYMGAYTDNGTKGFRVLPDTTYQFACEWEPVSTPRTINLNAYWYDASGAQVAVKTVATGVEKIGEYVTVRGSDVSPANAVTCAIYPIVQVPAIGEKHRLRNASAFESATPVEFFNGDFATKGALNYAWASAPSGSASYEYAVPVQPDFGTLDRRDHGARNLYKYPDFRSVVGFNNNSGISTVENYTGLSADDGNHSIHVIAGMENWGYYGVGNGSTIDVEATDEVTYSIYVLSRTEQELALVDYATGGTVGPPVVVKPWAWTRLTMTERANAAGYISVRDPGRIRVIDEIWLSAHQIEYGNEATPFFTGDNADDRFYTYEWAGVAGASASIRLAKTPESIEVISEPPLIVEVAWTDNYAEPLPTWTDITDRVQAFNSKLGRSTEIGAIEAGTLNLTLDNTDGAFTPGNPNSPFYPNVRPRRQVRLRLDDGSDPDAGLTPALANEVLNSSLVGDAQNCGLSVVQYPKLNLTGSALYLGDLTVTTHAGLGSTVVPFPCSPGDHVSAVGQDYPTGFSDTSSVLADFTVTVTFVDSTGATVDTFSQVASAPYKVTTPCQVVNALAPAGAVGYTVTFDGHSGDQVGNVLSGLGVYNTGQTAYAWPDGIVTAYSGSMRSTPEAIIAWEGIPNLSRSLVYFPAASSGVIARGYVQDWSPEFSGLASDLTVPVTDWLSGFGDDPLVHPLEWEIQRRNPADLFRFNEDSGTTRFVSANDPTKWAIQARAYEGGDIYTISGNEAPNVEGGESSLLPDGLPSESAIRANGQSVYTDTTQGDFYLGVCVNVPIPVIMPDTDSFSFTFLWKLFEKLKNTAGTNVMEPSGFVLHDSRTNLGSGAELSFLIDSTGNRLVRLRNNAGTPFDYLTGQDDGSTMFCGFSWDADTGNCRVAMTPVPTPDGTDPNANLEEGATFFEQGSWGSGDFHTAAEVLAGARFDRLTVLGYSDPRSIGGFGDQAGQYLARWDRALNSADFREIIATANGLTGHTVDERLNYILDSVNWPRQLRAISQSTSKVPNCGWENGTAAQEWLQSTADTALGSFYVDSNGRVTFRDRKDRANATPAFVFDHDSGTGVEAGLTFKSSEDDVVNVAEIDNAFGVTTTVINQASIDEFGRKRQSYSLRLLDNNEAIQYGYHMVNRYGDPHIRVDSVSFNPAAAAYGQLWGHATGVRIGQMVTCSGLPDTAPADSMDFFVESVAHNVERSGDRLVWTVTLDLSPSGLWRAWILGDPVYGVLGKTTRLIF